MPDERAKTIIAYTEEVTLIPQLEDGASRSGYRLLAVSDPAEIGAEGPPTPREIPLSEPLDGPDSIFLKQIVEIQPALILFDLSSNSIPWGRWIQVLKTSSATRRFPVLAFGSHLEEDKLRTADAAGANQVFPRGQFLQSLPDLIESWALVGPVEQIRSGCQGTISPVCKEGIGYHNDGDFIPAHHALEQAFLASAEYESYLYRSLLQFSAVQLHLQRENYRGAMKMILRLEQWLRPLPDECLGIDIRSLRSDAEEIKGMLESLQDNQHAPTPEGLTKLRPIQLAARTD